MQLRKASLEIAYRTPLQVFRWRQELYRAITGADLTEELTSADKFNLKIEDAKAILIIEPKKIVIQLEGILDPTNLTARFEQIFNFLLGISQGGWGTISLRLTKLHPWVGTYQELIVKLKEKLYQPDLPFLLKSSDAGVYLTLNDGQAKVNYVFGPFTRSELVPFFLYRDEEFPDSAVFLEVNYTKPDIVEVTPKEIRAVIRHTVEFSAQREVEIINLRLWQQQQ